MWKAPKTYNDIEFCKEAKTIIDVSKWLNSLKRNNKENRGKLKFIIHETFIEKKPHYKQKLSLIVNLCIS